MTDTTKPVEPVTSSGARTTKVHHRSDHSIAVRMDIDGETVEYWAFEYDRRSLDSFLSARKAARFSAKAFEIDLPPYAKKSALDAANAEIERLTGANQRLAKALIVAQNEAERYAGQVLSETQRADEAEAESAALVAVAYEAAAISLQNVADNWDCGHMESRLCDCGPYAEQWGIAADEVRNLPPADATAALEAYGAAKVREGWEAGMKEASKVEAFMPGSGKMKPMMKPWQDAILAAIKEKQP